MPELFTNREIQQASNDGTSIPDFSNTISPITAARIRRQQQQILLIKKLSTLAQLHRQESQTFRNLTTLEGDPVGFFNKIVNRESQQRFLNIKPFEMSSMIPKIKLYKMFYRSGSDTKGVAVEFKFADHTNLDALLASPSMRGDGAGILDFNVSLEGKNPATLRNVTANLKLYFQDMQTLLAEREATDLPSDFPIRNYRYSDLIAPATSLEHSYSDKKYHRIRAVIGWNIGNNADPSLLEATRNLTMIFDLELMKHELSFQENGSIELSVDYVGSLEGILNSDRNNLFLLNEEELKQRIEDNIKVENQKRKTAEPKKEQTTVEKLSATTKQVLDNFEEKNFLTSKVKSIDINAINTNPTQERIEEIQLETLETAAQINKQRSRHEVYSSFIHNLAIKFNKMYYMEVDKTNLGVLETGFSSIGTVQQGSLPQEKITRDQVEAASNRLNTLLPFTDTNFLQKQQTDTKLIQDYERQREQDTFQMSLGRFDFDSTELQSALDKIKSQTINLWGQRFVTNLTEKERDANVNEVSAGIGLSVGANRIEGDKVRIPFFYLGDLIDVVLDILRDNSLGTINEDFHFITGPIVYFNANYSLLGRYEAINIADIPVSMDLFNNWFIENVIAKLRDKYTLEEFLRDVIQTLVIPALDGTQEENTLKISYTTQVNMTELTFQAPNSIAVGKRNRIEDVTINSSFHRIDNVSKYIFMYISSFVPNILNGIEEDDNFKGIYHLGIGKDRGIVMKMNFKKTDIKYQREARLITSSNADPDIFREFYNCDVTLFGNPLFLLGQYVFINPSSVSFGNPRSTESLASKLGISGYYQILKIDHNISAKQFETQLSCIFQNPPTIGATQSIFTFDNEVITSKSLINDNDLRPDIRSIFPALNNSK